MKQPRCCNKSFRDGFLRAQNFYNDKLLYAFNALREIEELCESITHENCDPTSPCVIADNVVKQLIFLYLEKNENNT
jgi:hypothetical protein